MKELKINNQNLNEIINDILYKSNRIFVSEADFQFFFAWELKEKLKKNYDIILEYPINKGKMEYIENITKRQPTLRKKLVSMIPTIAEKFANPNPKVLVLNALNLV